MSKEIYNRMVEISNRESVELKSDIVEFAGVKDISKKLKQVYDGQKKLDKSVPAFEKLSKDIQEQKAMLKITVKEADSLISEIEKGAKSLGINPNEFPDFKQLSIEVGNSKSEYLK